MKSKVYFVDFISNCKENNKNNKIKRLFNCHKNSFWRKRQ